LLKKPGKANPCYASAEKLRVSPKNNFQKFRVSPEKTGKKFRVFPVFFAKKK
jgi:hypothetical protein